jgi:hypothetical protein
MLYRVLSLSLMTLALGLFVSAAVTAQEKAGGALKNTHEGTVVKVTAEKITMKGKGDTAKEHTHTLAANAKVTCDGKACKLEDLRPGQRVRVTTKADDRTTAIRVDALDKERTFKGGASDRER